MSDLERVYLDRWAERIAAQIGREALAAMRRPERDRRVAAILAPMGAEPHEVTAIQARLTAMVRDQAPPADTPAVRGSARMYR